MSNQHHLLQNFYLFKDWSAADLDKVSHLAKAEIFNPGEAIFSEGDQAARLFIIQYGTVRIQRQGRGDSDVNVATLGTGAHFGEMPFLDGEKRSASAEAVERAEAIAIGYEDLRTFLNAHPDAATKFYRSLATFLCGRLRVTTTDLSFSREKNLRHF